MIMFILGVVQAYAPGTSICRNSNNDLSISRSFRYVGHPHTYNQPNGYVCRHVTIVGSLRDYP